MEGRPRLDRARSAPTRFRSIPHLAVLLGVGAVCAALLIAARGEAYTVFARVSPDITANPIHVVIWVRDNVSAQDMADTVAGIEAGLAMWEGVPTSHISFDTEVIQSASEPPTAPEDLLVIVAYAADLTQGGASLPSFDPACPGTFPAWCPGTWFGAVADYPGSDFPLVAAHEIGHTIGLGHSSIGTLEFSTNIPTMHWALAGVAGLTADDAAVISHQYPSATTPLGSVTGTITGRLVSLSTGLPITGINVVAVDATTGDPNIAKLSGTTFSPGPIAAGEFHLIGLPPGVSTEVRLLDGKSFAGSSYGLDELAIQADNFESATLGPFVPTAGATIALGDIAVEIEPLEIDRIGLGPDPDPGDLDPLNGVLPPGSVGQEYEAYLHLRGGVRPVDVTSSDLPPGFTPVVVSNRFVNADPHGDTLVYLHGVPSFVGGWPTPATLTDAHGVATATPAFVLPASDPCAPALGADADADGVCDDGAGNGTPVDQPCAGGQTAGCDDNCRFVPNPAQLDSDTDGAGNACDGPPDTVLIDFETLGDGTVLPPGFTSMALDAFADLGLRVSPSRSNLGGPLKQVNNGYLSTPDPSGFSGHFIATPGNSSKQLLQFTLNPPVTHVEFDWATSDEVRVIARDELGQIAVDTVFPGTTTFGTNLDAGHAVLNPPDPIASLQVLPPPSFVLFIDNLEFTQTGCAIGLDPDGDGTCASAVPVPEPGVLALWIAGGALLAALHRRRERRTGARVSTAR